jgi:hypothetical protein
LAFVALTRAAPSYDSYNTVAAAGSKSPVSAAGSSRILQQVQQLNEDGSYTFGYENSDGSFRMENRDASGFVVGRYGYIDIHGKFQEIGSILF